MFSVLEGQPKAKGRTVFGATDNGHRVTNHVQKGFRTYLESIDLRSTRFSQYFKARKRVWPNSLIYALISIFMQVF